MAFPGMTGGDIPQWLQEWLLQQGEPQVQPQVPQVAPTGPLGFGVDNGNDSGYNGYTPPAPGTLPNTGNIPNWQDIYEGASAEVGGLFTDIANIPGEVSQFVTDIPDNISQFATDIQENPIGAIGVDQRTNDMTEGQWRASQLDTGSRIGAGVAGMFGPFGSALGALGQGAANVNADNAYSAQDYTGYKPQGFFGNNNLFQSNEDFHRMGVSVQKQVDAERQAYEFELAQTAAGQARLAAAGRSVPGYGNNDGNERSDNDHGSQQGSSDFGNQNQDDFHDF